MTKEEFGAAVERLIQSEEELITTYSAHLNAVLQWSGLGEAEKLEARSILAELAEDSAGHKRIFETMRDTAATGGIDVY